MRSKQTRLPYQCYDIPGSTADGNSVDTLHSAKYNRRRAGKTSSYTFDEGLISVPISVCSDRVSLSIGETSTKSFERMCVDEANSDLISVPVMYGSIDIPPNDAFSEDEDRKLNATYIISVARKLGFAIFLLPEDIIEVNQKMVLTLTASSQSSCTWSLQKRSGVESTRNTAEENTSIPEAESEISDMTMDETGSPSLSEALTEEYNVEVEEIHDPEKE